MPTIRYAGESYVAELGENVLDVLLREGVDKSYSCRQGICLSCITHCAEGEISDGAQKNIKHSIAKQGYFLACQAKVGGDMVLATPDTAALYTRTKVKSVEDVNDNVIRLVLQAATPLYYHAGQYANLRRPDGLSRSYSMASVPFLDSGLEFHIRRMPGGRMSNWIADHLKVGHSIDLQGPNGSCYYLTDEIDKPLLLIGTGSGLAPLYGIARDALFSGHTGPVHFYHGSAGMDGLYFRDRMKDIAELHPHFNYVPCLSKGAPPTGVRGGRASEAALADFPNLKGWIVYICGEPDMVHDMQEQAFIAGAAIRDIHADAFEYRDKRSEPREPPDDKSDDGL